MKKIIAIISLGLLTVVGVKAQWTMDSLNTAAANLLSATTSSEVVFTNGTEWNIFDVTTNTHTSGILSISRSMIDVAQYGEKVYFGGGKYGYFADPVYTKNVDVYNAATNTWSILKLSKAREVGGAGALGNKIVFAGGSGRDFGGPVYLYNKVDIFDATTGARTTAKISKARSNIAVGAAGNKIVFAGGWYWDIMYNVLQANTVDIYDVTTGVWTKTMLSKKRESIGVAVVGNKIIFAGGAGGTFGGALNNVDVYDASTNTWITSNLPVARYGMQSAVAGTKAYFAGGYGGAVNAVEVYDASTNTWSTLTIPVAFSNFSISSINGKVYFAGGYDDASATFSNLVQIYDPSTGIWTNEYLSEARSSLRAATIGNTGIFAGGTQAPSYPVTYSNRVDFYEAPLRLIPDTYYTASSVFEMSMFPNPVTEQVQLVVSDKELLPVSCMVYDRSGRLVMSFDLINEIGIINMTNLPSGNYILYGTDNSSQHISKVFIKQ